jgi:prephenate dehydrogenase
LSQPFERIAIVGLGLLGGSAAAAIRRAKLARVVVGSSRSREAREFALRHHWVDEAASAVEAARGADLVVLATPVFAMAGVLEEMASELRPPAIVTDVGSVKAQLAETLPGLLPSGVRYLGSHPMAGSHERGIEHAREDLFDNTTCVVMEGGDLDAQERLSAFWSALGASVVIRNPVTHDEQVAWTSHIPHALAFGFSAAFRDAPAGSGDVVGGGFRDFTRIAQSDPELWGDILTANRKALVAPFGAVSQAFGELGRVIEANDPEGVERWIAEARETLVLLQSPTALASPAGEGHPAGQTTDPRAVSKSNAGNQSEKNT